MGSIDNMTISAVRDEVIENIVTLREKIVCLRSRVKELEENLARKVCELENATEKYKTKQWHEFVYHSPNTGLGSSSELAAQKIREMRAKAKDLKAKYQNAVALAKKAQENISNYGDACRLLREEMEYESREGGDKQVLEAIFELLEFRKNALYACRKKYDRLRAELRITQRALERVLTGPDIRQAQMLNVGKDCAQQMLDLNLQLVQMQRLITELQLKLQEANDARQKSEEHIAREQGIDQWSKKDMKSSTKKLWSLEPTVYDLLDEKVTMNARITKLRLQINKAIGDREVLREAKLELNYSNQHMAKELEYHITLLREVQRHLSSSNPDWQSRMKEEFEEWALRMEAIYKKEEAESVLQKDRERFNQLQSLLPAQTSLISLLQKHREPADVQLFEESAVWLPLSLMKCLGPSYYGALLAVVYTERSLLISLLTKAAEKVEAMRGRWYEAQQAFVLQRWYTRSLEWRLKMAETATRRKLSTPCTKYKQSAIYLQEELQELRMRVEELRKQNMADLRECSDLMLLQQQQVYRDAMKSEQKSNNQ